MKKVQIIVEVDADEAPRAVGKIEDAITSFELRQSNFEQTISAMNQLWDQMVAAWQRIGGSVGRNSISDQRRFFEAAQNRVEELQAARNARGDLIASLPVPEFETGGVVPGVPGQPVMARVHAGELVLRREAAETLGRDALQRLNRGDRGGELTVNIQAVDAKGVERLIQDNRRTFGNFVTSVVRRGRGRGAALAGA